MGSKGLGLSVLLGLFVGACSGGDRRIYQAPSSEAELGSIVTNVSQEELEQNTNFRFRVVNKKQKIFDVRASKSEIESLLPDATVEPNKLDSQLIPSLEYQNRSIQEQQQLNRFISNCQPGNKIRLLARNKRKNQPKEKLTSFTVGEIGDTLSLEAVPISVGTTPDNQFLWVFSHTGLDKYEKNIYSGPTVDVLLKGVGRYTLTLVIKTKNNQCGVTNYTHLVTSNKPYVENIEESLSFNLSDFLHVEAANIQSTGVLRDSQTIVAVIDSGVNYNHPSLNSKILLNEAEIPNNGVDDDENGFVDDYAGFDFFNVDSSAMDDLGHGTHVAGLVAGTGFGAGENIKILPIKVGSPVGVDSASVAGAIFYAVDRGAKVINLSLGSTQPLTQIEMDAYRYAQENEVLIIAAAGNGDRNGNGLNIDRVPHFPASLDLDNVLTVTASSVTSQTIARYANFGEGVDLVAPGGDFFSPLLSASIMNNEGIMFVAKSGTSMAAPVVAGAAGELLSIDANLSAIQVKELLISSGREDALLNGLIKNSKHLDLQSAIDQLESGQGRLAVK